MKTENGNTSLSRVSAAGLLITLGIVYGDIGTSPLYTFNAILSGTKELTELFVLGGISCIIWTLTLQTTVKYILITLRADNKGEGGIFSLFALIRRKAKWAFIFALIGGCALLADGVITPAITIVSSIEGLRIINPDIPVIPIVICILAGLFFVQRFGTKFLGTSFGPIMLVWFVMLGVLGISQIAIHPFILKAFNPVYAVRFLTVFPNGFILLGAVFLCTTGAEALYSDLGHCGYKNIRVSWIFVKATLILNYLGQGAWILSNPAQFTAHTNPFFGVMPHWFLLFGIIMATAAAIIASQALISGSYTIISEAIQLGFSPKLRIKHPTNVKGQMFIPAVNGFLFISCVFVVLFFQDSQAMEAAYGLAITITMLMTTVLLSIYLRLRHTPRYLVNILLVVFLTIEISFLIANLYKFPNGGWFSLLITSILFIIMYVSYKSKRIKSRFEEFVKINHYLRIIKDLSQDESVPKYASNLVFMTRSPRDTDIEPKIIYSILNIKPKRADTYWFIHVDVTDDPYTKEYTINPLIPDHAFRIDLKLGFRVPQRINLYFHQVINEMVKSFEIDTRSRYSSLRKYNITGDFRFVIIERIQNYDFDFGWFDQLIMDLSGWVEKIGITHMRAFGLDTSNVEVEKAPLITPDEEINPIRRVQL